MSQVLQNNRRVLVAANHLTQAAELVQHLEEQLAEAKALVTKRRCEVVDELDALRDCDPDAWPSPLLKHLRMGDWQVEIHERYFDCSLKYSGVVVSKIAPPQMTNIGEAIAQLDRQIAQERPAQVAEPVEVEHEAVAVAPDCGCNPKQKEACARRLNAEPSGPCQLGCRNA